MIGFAHRPWGVAVRSLYPGPWYLGPDGDAINPEVAPCRQIRLDSPLRESRYHPHQQAPFGPPGASAGRNQPYYPDFRTRLVVTLSWLADGRECQLIAAEEYLAESFTLLE